MQFFIGEIKIICICGNSETACFGKNGPIQDPFLSLDTPPYVILPSKAVVVGGGFPYYRLLQKKNGVNAER